MLLAIIAGIGILSLLGGIVRFALSPVAALSGLIRFAAFAFAGMCWLAYYVLDDSTQNEVLPAAIGGTVVWVASLLLPGRR